MKIALLLFGQLRWINNPYTTNSHHEAIINLYDTDVFGSFWNPENSDTLSQSGHIDPKTGKPFTVSPSVRESTDKIQQLYKFKNIKFSDPMKFEFADTLYEKSISRKWPEIYIDGWFQWPNAFNNILSQLYSIQSVCRLLEEESNNYDMIIISRPDICIWQYPNLNYLDKSKFYLSSHHTKFPDLQFIFSPKYLKAFSNVFDNTVSITDEELYSLWEPNAEALKYNSYRKYFDNNELNAIPLPVRIVRGQDCRGPQW